MKASNASNPLHFVSGAGEPSLVNSALKKHSLKKGQAKANPLQTLESCLLPAQTSTYSCIRHHHSPGK